MSSSADNSTSVPETPTTGTGTGTAATTTGGEPSASKAQSQKRVVIPPPPCPPAVATAYLLLRGALLGILGVAPNDDTTIVSLLQPTYIKDKALTAKFGIQLGKKHGNGVVPLTDVTASVLFDRLSDAVNRLISEQRPIHVTCPMTKQDAVLKYGTHIMDANMMKKTKDTDMVMVASIPGIVQCIPPAMPYATTSGSAVVATAATDTATGMTAITILPSPDSSITYGARKAEVVMKFQVQVTGEGILCEPTMDGFDLDLTLLEKIIRVPEGQTLYDQQQQVEADEAAAAEAAKKEEETIATATTTATTSTEMVVNAFEVSGKIDYAKLVDKFGSKIIEHDLMQRLTQLTVGQGRVPHLHRFLRRNIFFSHRDLNLLLDCVQQQQQQQPPTQHSNKNVSPFYLYTGRGPSSTAMHLGHLVPFLFTQWLQQAFDCPLVIQMTDDEKFLFKGEYSEETGDNLNYFRSLTMENAKDIIACGFNKDKTFIFSDCDYVGRMYPNICRIWKAVTTNTVNGIFGFDGTSNIGKIAFPAIQAAPSFVTSFPVVLKDAPPTTACLIPCAIDQDPYFRMTRDVAHKLVPPMMTPMETSTTHTETGTTSKKLVGHLLGGKPALIHSKFFPPLQGSEGKMSSSDTNSAIFLTDSAEEISKKITKFAYSGGQETRALQEELGADLDADVSYQWLRFFLEDDEELEAIGASYKSGSGDYWSTGMVKKRLITVLQELVAAHQERRAKITDEEVREWMQERCIL